MNKTISINLGGSVFNIEEVAFQILKNYLESILANFSNDPASAEIMSDIEERIAEIFHEKNSDKKNVITQEDVSDMTTIMGNPEDYKIDGDESTAPEESQQTSGKTRNSRRRIYRDTDDAMIAGVCSGLSHYLRWDPLVIRLLLVFLTIVSFGFPGVLGYIIFWALVPPAKTTAEKLHMRGENVNVENIGRFVNDEARQAAERISKAGRTASQNIRKHSGEFLHGFGRVIAVIFGLFILMIGLGLLTGLLSLIILSEFNIFGFDGDSWTTINQIVFANDGTIWIMIIGIAFALGAPAIGLIYAAIKLITGSTKRIKGFGISLLSLFIIGMIMCAYGGIRTGKEFNRHAGVDNTTLLSEVTSDTLYFNVMHDDVFIGRNSRDHDFTDLIKIDRDVIYYGDPIDIQFEASTSNQFKIDVEKKCNGKNLEQAGSLARNIVYPFVAVGDSIILSPHFTTPRNDLYRGQNLIARISIPIGKYVRFGPNSSLLTWYSEENGVMRMSEDGLESEKEYKLKISAPNIKVTDDSVIIKTNSIEINASRD